MQAPAQKPACCCKLCIHRESSMTLLALPAPTQAAPSMVIHHQAAGAMHSTTGTAGAQLPAPGNTSAPSATQAVDALLLQCKAAALTTPAADTAPVPGYMGCRQPGAMLRPELSIGGVGSEGAAGRWVLQGHVGAGPAHTPV